MTGLQGFLGALHLRTVPCRRAVSGPRRRDLERGGQVAGAQDSYVCAAVLPVVRWRASLASSRARSASWTRAARS
jgi:hypothetical protein